MFMVIPLDKDAILTLLNDKTIDVTLVKTIASTNNAFEKHTASKQFAICLTETQTQGRGQLQRVWHSPSGENIYLSLCYFSSTPLDMLAPLSLVIGSSLCEFLNTHFSLKYPAQIKWPNDILCDHAKLAGILIETKKISEKSRRVVIGIGLNVNMQAMPENTISQPWTSLLHLTGQSHDRNPICAHLINQLQTAIQHFEMNNLSNDVVDIWTIEKNKLALLSYDWERILSKEEKQRANQFHFDKDKTAFMIYHAAKRLILSKYLNISPEDIVITIREKGKPYLQNSDLQFNLSHAQDIAVLAVAHHTEVGVDIEYSKKTNNFLDIAKRFFHPEEYQTLIDIQHPLEQQDYFYLLWTAKEALLKVTGEGISAGLNHFHVKLNAVEDNSLSHTYANNMALIRLDCPKNYAASLAIQGKQKKLQYHHFTPDE